MESLSFHIRGRVGSIMQADRLANPLDPLKVEIKKFTDKRKKTDADHEDIARIEYLASLYCDPKLGPYWPGQNVERMLYDAAKLSRRGQDVKRALMVLDDKVSILYKGPRTPKELYADRKFVDFRSVVIQNRRTMRCRPYFPEWECKFEIAYDPEVFNPETVLDILDTAGRFVGLSSYRPRYGRFEVLSPRPVAKQLPVAAE